MNTIIKTNGELSARALSELIGMSSQTIINRIKRNRPVLCADFCPKAERGTINYQISEFRRNHPDAEYFDSEGRFLGNFQGRGPRKQRQSTSTPAPQTDTISSVKKVLIGQIQEEILDLIMEQESVDQLLEILESARKISK